MPVICPHCFAEIDEDLQECFSCGGMFSEKVVEHSTVELAGSPLQEWNYNNLPHGTLLDNRFTILQFKERLMEGYCYIALDQSLVQRCFVVLWDSPHLIWQYHSRICLRSPVVHCNDQPHYSAFPPQEGMPLPQALIELEWTSGKTWEVFRQVCSLLAAMHHDGDCFSFLHPRVLWVRTNGTIEFSLQREELPADWQVLTWQEEVRNLIRLLFWLFTGELQDEHWDVLPPKLIPLFRRIWKDPVASGDLWLNIDNSIRNVGFYSMPVEAKEWLMQMHRPNIVQLVENQVQVPSSIQLCIWNCVRASWRLQDGKVLLYTNLIALYESGYVKHQDDVPLFVALRSFLLGSEEDFSDIKPIYQAYLLSEYGDIDRARNILAGIMRLSRRSIEWLEIARVLFSIYDQKEGWNCIRLAKEWSKSIEEKLEITAFLRWELGAISEAKQYLLTFSVTKETEHLLWLAEAWYCLFSSTKKCNQLLDVALHTAKDLSFERQLFLIKESIIRFGNVAFVTDWCLELGKVVYSELELKALKTLAERLQMDPQWIARLCIQEKSSVLSTPGVYHVEAITILEPDESVLAPEILEEEPELTGQLLVEEPPALEAIKDVERSPGFLAWLKNFLKSS